MEINKHIIIFSNDDSMNGVISKYYDMSCSTDKINYILYLKKDKVVKQAEKSNFKIIRYSYKLILFRYYPILKNINEKEINVIRYAGADFSLLLFNKVKKLLFWELHTNYLLELGKKNVIGFIVKFFELTLGKYILQDAMGVVTTSNSIFTCNKDVYKFKCNYHLLLNSFITPKYISFISSKVIVKDRYILIMASSFSFWHDLQTVIDLIESVNIKLVVIGNVDKKSHVRSIIYYGYVNDANELDGLISGSLFCIDSLGFDFLNLEETSSLKLFKYLEHGGRVVIFKNLPFIDSFLVPRYVIKLDDILDVIDLVRNLLPLTTLEKEKLKTHMRLNYSLDKLLSLEANYLNYENSRKE